MAGIMGLFNRNKKDKPKVYKADNWKGCPSCRMATFSMADMKCVNCGYSNANAVFGTEGYNKRAGVEYWLCENCNGTFDTKEAYIAHHSHCRS